jgi:hypothetical protein
LPNVFVFELWKLAVQFTTIGVRCHELHDTAHRQPQIANAGLTIHPGKVDRNAIELHHGVSEAFGKKLAWATVKAKRGFNIQRFD